MATIIRHPITAVYKEDTAQPHLAGQFMNWCERQQENRLLWLSVVLAGHGCVLTPLTIMAVVLAGTNLFLFIAALVAMAMALITNLAAMPTKITIPVFLLSVIIDLGIVVACLAIGFNTAHVF